MSAQSGPAERIRQHLASVDSLRAASAQVGTTQAVAAIKRLQALRFRDTYSDFLRSAEYAPAARFFLEELYGVRDFSTRDRQFARIAGGLERMFPAAVAELAVDLTELHALTERLDHDLALAWLQPQVPGSLGERYVVAWRRVGARDQRLRQLQVVSMMGAELEQLTRKRSLRTALKLMRSPARAAGLDALQTFLESGFDAFASMPEPRQFMQAIEEREQAWLTRLFDEEDCTCAAHLAAVWRGLDGSSTPV